MAVLFFLHTLLQLRWGCVTIPGIKDNKEGDDTMNLIDTKCETDCGEYTILAKVNDDQYRDEDIRLYVGRAEDGHCDLIASNNASMWVVGNEDDALSNKQHWAVIEGHGLDMDAVRAIDSGLAEWLEARQSEAIQNCY